MKHILLALCVVSLLFFSCRNKVKIVEIEDFPSDSLIEKSKMIDIFVDAFLIEAALYKAQSEGRSVQEYTAFYYDFFFKKHQVSKHRIHKSTEYYSANKMMEDIILQVVTLLVELDLSVAGDQNRMPEEATPHDNVGPAWLKNIPLPEDEQTE